MPAISKDDFLSCLRASNVIDDEKLKQALSEFESEDPKIIARELVRRKMLTLWQAKFLISGRKQLHLGNYQLLNRISRSEQGDRFLAVHTGLDRQVEIQLLPASLSNDQETIDHFIQKASRASTIDHPNLIHVYDIDQERGRYFLVEEHVAGNPLAVTTEDLSELEIAKILRQAFSGLLNAHQNQVVHGQVNVSNFILTDDKQLKIANLSLTPLVQTDVEEHSVFDLHDAASIGLDLLAAKTNANPASVAELSELLQRIGSISSQSEIAQPLEDLTNWIQLNDPDASAPILAAAEETVFQPAKRRRNRPSQNEVPEEPSPAPGLAERAKENPMLLMSIIGISALIILGLTAWLAFAMTRNNTQSIAKNNKPASSNSKQNSDANQNANAKTKKPANAADDAATQPDPDALKNVLAKLPVDGNALPPVEKTFPGKKENKPKAAPQNAGNKPANQNETNKKPVNKSTQPVSTPAKQPAAGGSTQPAVPQPKTVQPKNDNSAANTKKPEDEFAKFPPRTQLPDIGSTAPHKIGQINLAKNYLLALELVTGKAISKAKLSFDLQRTPDNKQKWAVNFKKRPKDPEVVVGYFMKNNEDFSFQWTAEATENDDANFLRNCMLRVKGKNKSAFLTLREPIIIKGFAYSEEEMSLEAESEINWLPHPEFLKIEIQPFKKDKQVRELIVEPRMVERKSPGRVFFASEPINRFGWIEVNADARSKLKLELAVKMQSSSKPRVTTLQKISDFATAVKAQAELTRKRLENVKAMTKPPPGMSRQQFDDSKKQLNNDNAILQNGALVAINLENGIKSMLGKPIPLSVYYELNGVRIVIAQTR